MAIARNKKADPAAIAAFGAQAEARVEATQPASERTVIPTPTPTPTRAASAPRTADNDGPKSSLVRWKGEEALRDRIKQFAKTQRYSEHEIMIRAMAAGMDKLEQGL